MLECRQTLKCEYVVQILSCLVCEAGVWKKSLLWALCCYFAPPHGAIMYPKTPAFSTAEIGKKYKTYVVAQSHRKNRDSSLLCFFFFLSPWDSFLPLFIFASKNTIEYAPLQGGSHWLVRAVSQVWPGTETQHTGDSPSGCCRALRCEEFPGWQGSQQKEGW